MADASRTKTVLGPDCKISGDLVLDNDAVIMGSVAGTLRVAGVLEVADSAQLSGTIVVGGLKLAGAAEADVVAEDAVELLPGAELSGQVYTSRINVAEGASFEGGIHIGAQAQDGAGEIIARVDAGNGSQGFDAEPIVSGDSANAMLQRRRSRPFGLQKRTPATNGAGTGQDD